jgi:hypothetical protein
MILQDMSRVGLSNTGELLRTEIFSSSAGGQILVTCTNYSDSLKLSLAGVLFSVVALPIDLTKGLRIYKTCTQGQQQGTKANNPLSKDPFS